MAHIVIMATNHNITGIRDTNQSPQGTPLDLLDRKIIICTNKFLRRKGIERHIKVCLFIFLIIINYTFLVFVVKKKKKKKTLKSLIMI